MRLEVFLLRLWEALREVEQHPDLAVERVAILTGLTCPTASPLPPLASPSDPLRSDRYTG